MSISKYTILVVLALALACTQDIEPAIDISNINVDFDIIDIHDQITSLDTNNVESALENLNQKHPAFYKILFENVLAVKDDEGNIDANLIKGFISDEEIKKIALLTKEKIDASDIEYQMEEAYKLAKHYFPDWHTPNIYKLISGFSYQRFLFEDEQGDAIGLGLDFFLGSDYPYKSIDPTNPSFSDYQTRTFNQDHVVKKCLELWIDDKIAPAESRLIDHMIRNGKKLYILDKLLPTVSDTIIMEYSEEQLDWAEDNQMEIWSYFFKEDLFYETNMRKIDKYISPRPDSPGMPDIAPGRVANFMGWQIVRSYMYQHPDKSLEMLIMERDAQKILDLSKYKPKRK